MVIILKCKLRLIKLVLALGVSLHCEGYKVTFANDKIQTPKRITIIAIIGLHTGGGYLKIIVSISSRRWIKLHRLKDIIVAVCSYHSKRLVVITST